MDLFHKVVHLVLDGTYLDGRVQQAGRPDYLLHDEPFGLAQFVLGRRGADIDLLAGHGLELLESQRPVVGGCGQAEAILDEYGLARMVAAEHGMDLRQGHMALVYEGDEIVGEIVDKAERPLAGLPPVEISGIILDTGTIAHLLDHLEIIFDALF